MIGFLRRLFDKEPESNEDKKEAPLYIVGAQSQTHSAAKTAPTSERQPAQGPSNEEPFDPYNTGAFNRSKSWERISKQRDR